MRRRRDRRREMPAGQVPQCGLFAQFPAASSPGTAVWRALPEGTRRTLTDLLARLLLEHGANARHARGRHDR